jgi:hypothetical protein
MISTQEDAISTYILFFLDKRKKTIYKENPTTPFCWPGEEHRCGAGIF